nr:MAG TPA: hypothetical protein [Caudoviricetes sp.]
MLSQQKADVRGALPDAAIPVLHGAQRDACTFGESGLRQTGKGNQFLHGQVRHFPDAGQPCLFGVQINATRRIRGAERYVVEESIARCCRIGSHGKKFSSSIHGFLLSNTVFCRERYFVHKSIGELLPIPESTERTSAAVVDGILIEAGHTQTVIDTAQLHDSIGSKRDLPSKLAVFVQCVLAHPLERRYKIIHRDGGVGSPVVKNAAVARKNDLLFDFKVVHKVLLISHRLVISKLFFGKKAESIRPRIVPDRAAGAFSARVLKSDKHAVLGRVFDCQILIKTGFADHTVSKSSAALFTLSTQGVKSLFDEVKAVHQILFLCDIVVLARRNNLLHALSLAKIAPCDFPSKMQSLR